MLVTESFSDWLRYTAHRDILSRVVFVKNLVCHTMWEREYNVWNFSICELLWACKLLCLLTHYLIILLLPSLILSSCFSFSAPLLKWKLQLCSCKALLCYSIVTEGTEIQCRRLWALSTKLLLLIITKDVVNCEISAFHIFSRISSLNSSS